MFCSDCGVRNRDGARFCRDCGQKLDGPAFVDAARAAQSAAARAVPESVRSNLSYATFTERVGAFMLDWLLLTAIGLGVGIVVGLLLPSDDSMAFVQVFSLIAVVCYYAGYESSAHQATPGKQQLGLKVTDLRGHRLTFMDAAFRWLAKLVSLVILGVGFLFPLWTARKQTLHDLMVGAVVVKRSVV